MHTREHALHEWLSTLNHEPHLVPLAGDASFRRYFRVYAQEQTFIAMDAPPEQEDVQPFLKVAQILTQSDILVPEIFAIDQQQGFLLLKDFGDHLLLDKLNEHTAEGYYCDAMSMLFKMQQANTTEMQLPVFDKKFMLQEMNLCPEWFFKTYLSLNLTDHESTVVYEMMEWIAGEVAQQPLVFIHRDYHSRNLMLVTTNTTTTLGVLDFQDAMHGPFTYDLVSLLKDCYISWPREQVLKWVAFFYEYCLLAPPYSLSEFIKAFDLCGLQRHLKILGIFCRLYLRDHKSGYLHHLPLTLNYVLECTKIYEELHPLHFLLQKKVHL